MTVKNDKTPDAEKEARMINTNTATRGVFS